MLAWLVVGATVLSAPVATGAAAAASSAAKCPLTAKQVRAATGEKLAGPKAPLNSYEICVFGRTQPGKYHLVQVTVYTPATLKSFGSNAARYLKMNRHPNASTVKAVGTAAFVQDGDIWATSRSGALLNIGADFVISNKALTALARDAIKKL